MAYQNSMNMTVEAFKALTQRVSTNTAQALHMFEEEKKLFNSLSNISQNSSIKQISNSVEYVSGIPGTQHDAIEQITGLISYIFQCSTLSLNQTDKVINSINAICSTTDAKLNDHLTDMCSYLNQVDLIKKSIKNKDIKIPKKLSKYQKSINSIVTMKTKVKKPSEVVHLLEKISAIRKDNLLNRSNFVYTGEKCLNQISTNSKIVIELMKNDFQNKKEIYQSYIRSNQEIIAKCQDISNQFLNILNSINFQKDFQNYINKNKIIRHDIIPEQFKPLNFDHECFSQLATVTKVLSIQLYPFAMAKVKKEFVAKDNNELSVQKGKLMLLMEDLSLPWVYVQNPYTKVMGYAPSSFFEIIGNGLGVLLKDTQSKYDILHKGDYVATVGYINAGSYDICTILDIMIKVPASNIGIISEF
ncbi:hypothetical protein M9Y10_000312 [Tritrichomonas musculus]|uniref:SH3 domain-containing protein n=1 Tax=Tritrichomonas musculus TaxID=1915356 RepID=A0ABR2L5M5_9EUKA